MKPYSVFDRVGHFLAAFVVSQLIGQPLAFLATTELPLPTGVGYVVCFLIGVASWFPAKAIVRRVVLNHRAQQFAASAPDIERIP